MKTLAIIIVAALALFVIPFPLVLIALVGWALVKGAQGAGKKAQNDVELIKSIAKKVTK